jgi:mannose-6-phosphate isomerase-like protein (cupin superfamily)
MKSSKDYIDSGILMQYVLGNTSPRKSTDIEKMAATDSTIRLEIEAISEIMEAYAIANAVDPNPVLKPFLLATIDYTERMKSGEPASNPPMLNEHSVIEEYAEWLNRNDMVSRNAEDLFAKIIGYTPAATTAIVWIKDYAPQEVHDDEYEKFLIVEGTCNIMVEEDMHTLIPGDYFAIPLHKKHSIKVTSFLPCKVILQRVAA